MRVKQYATLIVIALTMPATMHAQIGGLIKKAANAAVSRAEDKAAENTYLKPSSAFGPELTEQTLDAVIRGLAASHTKLQDAKEFRTARQKIDAEYAKSTEAHEKDRLAYEESARKVETCQAEFLDNRRRDPAVALEKLTDQAEQAKKAQAAMEAAQKVSAAQAKNDTAEMRRLMVELATAHYAHSKADSAAAIKHCGPVPAKPAWLAEQQSLRERSSALDRQIREAESGAHSSAASASGMGDKEYSLARERVLHWYLEVRHGRKIQQFGPNERRLLEGRRGDIDKYSSAL